MTDLLDLYYCSLEQNLNRSHASYNSRQSKQQIKAKQINQLVQKLISKIDKNYIKTVDSYVFRLDKAKNKLQDGFYNYPVNLIGTLQIQKQQYSLRIQFHNQKGQKIIVQSPYHRVLISNFVLQINAQLENFKIQYNPVAGESYFIFNVQTQNTQIGGLIDFLDFGLDVYFQQCSAHFYLLNLLQVGNQNDNNYLREIKQKIDPIKQWIGQRLIQNQIQLQETDFYYNYVKQVNYENKIPFNKPKRMQNLRHIEQIQQYLYSQCRQIIQDVQLSENKMYKIYKKFQNYYSEEKIFSLHLINKINHQNYLNINVIQTMSLIAFLSKRGILNGKQFNNKIQIQPVIQQKNRIQQKQKQRLRQQKTNQFQLQSQNKAESDKKNLDNETISIHDKDSGKNYIVKSLFLANKQSLMRQYKICQKFCHFESYKFMNQYISLSNYQFQKNVYAFVNAYPKRIPLTEFVESNVQTLSINAKLRICINIIQIVLIVQKKNKINNYFPSFIPVNLQISENLYVNLRILSHTSKYPLYQLCNTISYIFFGKSISYTQRNSKIPEINKGDEFCDKYYGPSYCVLLLKYYLLELHQEAIRMENILQVGPYRKISQQELEQIQVYNKKRLVAACQQLLVIFNNYETIFYRDFDQQYALKPQEINAVSS